MVSYKNSDERLPIMIGSPPALIPPYADWDRPPWNRWSFQHVREVLPTAEVWRGPGPPREFERREGDVDDLQVSLPSGGSGTLLKLLDETYTDGFLIVKS